jgi:hypothetical protein
LAEIRTALRRLRVREHYEFEHGLRGKLLSSCPDSLNERRIVWDLKLISGRTAEGHNAMGSISILKNAKDQYHVKKWKMQMSSLLEEPWA